MRGNLYDDFVTIQVEEGSKKPISLHEKSHFGKLENDILELSLIEAFYLLENNRLNVFEHDKKLSIDELRNVLKRKELYGKYVVFRDLKTRGYIIKTGFKYGSDFRLYERGKSPGSGHARYLVKIIFEDYNMGILNFASYVRVAHGVNKSLLIAIVDEELDITYYTVEWTRP